MSIVNDKLKNYGKPFAKTDNDSGILTLYDLRKFIKDCDELNVPNETELKISFSEGDFITNITSIEGDDIDIVFYNW